MDRPTFLTEALERDLITELLRTPKDHYGACRRALARQTEFKDTNVNGVGLNLQRYFEFDEVLQNRYFDAIEGADLSSLPNKAVIASEILDLARKATDKGEASQTMPSIGERDFALRAYRLYGEITGMIDKNGMQAAMVNNGVIVNKVMVIPPAMSLEDWSAHAKGQQEKLIDASVSAKN